MSDALLRIASSMILLTKRTIGASSTSSREASESIASSPCETSRFSRSKSSSPPAMAGICVSTCSIAFCTARWSLSSSTTTASMARPVWNLISSTACRMVGSETPTCRRFPRLTSGSTRCFASSLSLTRRTVSRSGTPRRGPGSACRIPAPRQSRCRARRPCRARRASSRGGSCARGRSRSRRASLLRRSGRRVRAAAAGR